MESLQKILGPEAARFLESIPAPPRWPSVADLDDELEEWGRNGAHIAVLGRSLEGRRIRAAEISLGQTEQTLFAWGYPHPDEPIGAAALQALGRAALRGELSFLEGWKLVLVLCADPDQASRQTWLRENNMRSWAAGVWRPTHLGLEIDYGFPIDHPPFFQPPAYDGACHTDAECAFRHSGPPCPRVDRPFAPLPESKALLEGLRRYRPSVVASMHSTHTGGDYTFLLNREKRGTEDDLLAIPGASGSVRYLGEAIDRGRRWRTDAPDLIREYTLENFESELRRNSSYEEGLLYAGNASAASVIESELPGTQFICPETSLFRHQDFGDTRPSGKKIEVQSGAIRRPRGLYEVLLFRQGSEWIVGQQERASRSRPLHQEKIWAPRSVLGARALVRRRRSLEAADRVWSAISAGTNRHHLYEEERRRLQVPGAYVGDRSMLIFRSREDYRRRATRAQEASFAWMWPAHTASLLGNFSSWLRAQDKDRPEIQEAVRKIQELQEKEIRRLPETLQEESPREIGMRSQLGRVIRLLRERSK